MAVPATLFCLRRLRPVLLAYALLVAVLPPAEASRAPRHRAPRLRMAVAPSEAIETRVGDEVAAATLILDELDADNAFESPYLVSAFYYHDGFLHGYPDSRPDANPARRIIARLGRELTPERKAQYVALLHRIWAGAARERGAPAFVAPVRSKEPRGRRRTHRYAIDLFAPQGSPVSSASPGIVLLAECGWTRGDPFSTSSQSGGNSVIVFDPETDRFYRYCHLATVAVSPGDIVEAGRTLGTVGNTGVNASRQGHGRHLHFEVNRYDGQVVRPFTNMELRAMLKSKTGEPALASTRPARKPARRARGAGS